MDGHSTAPTEFKQSLNRFDATMVVAGSMIGSGIFIVSADMVRTLGGGGWLLLAWVLAGILTMLAALSYGELAGMFPKAGGQYVYLREAYNPLIGFLYGWTMFAVIQTGTIAAVAVAFAKFTSYFIPFFGEKNVLLDLGDFHFKGSQLLGILLVIFLTWLNAQGIKTGKWVQSTFTTAKLLALFGLIVLGFLIGFNAETWAANTADFWAAFSTSPEGSVTTLAGTAILTAVGAAMVGSLFSSDAWNNVTFIASEVKNPRRNLPLALFFGTLAVSLLYILANIMYLGVLPLHGDPAATDVIPRGIAFAESDRVATAAAWMIFGGSAAAIMSGLIMVSTFGCNNGLILAGARLYYAMAKDGLFFKKAGELNRNAVPQFGLWAQCVWTCVLCLSGTYGDLLDYTIFAALLFYVLTIAGIFLLRKKMPDAERPYRAWGYPVAPVFYILVASAIALILLFFKSENTVPGLVIVLAGIPVYFLIHRKKRA